MAARIFGSVGEFNSSLEVFPAYLERIEEFFIANDIGEVADDANAAQKTAADRKKVAVIISIIGSKTYNTLRDLSAPSAPKEKSFKEICDLLTSFYKPKNLEVAGAYKFHACVQSENENIAEYCARLRRLATDCNFGAFLPRALRDKFISGIRDNNTKKKLLSQDIKTLEDATKIAIADEAAKRETQLLTNNNTVHTVATHPKNQPSTFPRQPQWQQPQKPPAASNDQKNFTYKCFSCGETGHLRKNCKHRDKICRSCNTKGHIARVCKKPGVHAMQDNSTPDDSELEGDMYNLHDLNNISSSHDIQVQLKVEGLPASMQLDTGCAYTLAPKSFYTKYCQHIPLKPTSIVLSTYTGEKISPLGEIQVDIEYKSQSCSLPLLIVENGPTALLGRNWLRHIQLDWKGTLNTVTPASKGDLDTLLNKHNAFFDSSLGCYNGSPVQLKVQQDPKFYKARPVPYAQKPKVEQTLLKMEEEGVLKRITSASCAAPIVVVNKKDSENVRICGDFSVTYNKCAEVETYPLPKIEDIYEAVRGCNVFSILDISQAYHQIPIAEESQQYLTINTHMGLFSFTRLPNGVHSGPAIFQRIMDSTLAGISRSICYIDDILVAGVDEQDHLNTLSQVFQKLDEAGFKLNKDKCRFNKSSVTYLGHVIDGSGLHPTEEKLRAIQDAPRPRDVTALKSFLGLLMFYSRFLPNHSTVLAPLNNLLKKDVQWKWTRVEQQAFSSAKKLLIESQTLVHYDDRLPLYLSCDASSYGAGAVLSHMIDNAYRPIAFASCSLTTAQKNYSQLDKEALSIIFGLKKFHQYLSGRTFTIITDHRPLLSLFAPDRPVPLHVAARLQRWSLVLQSYNYSIQYRNTNAHADADSMSRVPLPETWEPPSHNVNCYFFNNEDMSYLSSDMIKKATATDPTLSRVLEYTMTGWPQKVDPSLANYANRQTELTVEQGCLLWGLRVIVPTNLRDKVLQELHETHPGMTRMKSIARSYVWWPNIDADIEKTVKSCHVCQVMRNHPAEAPVHPWCYPTAPWQRLHIDFKGPVQGRMYLVVVDAYSKYPEVVHMPTTTATVTIKVLREIFSRHGLPETIVSDNGPQFISEQFSTFCKKNGIIHRKSAPYKPSTNGQAERIVQVLSTAINQAILTGEDIDIVISRHMLVYRNTPHSTTGELPAMLLMKRRLRTRLDLLKPSVQRHVQYKQNAVVQGTVSRTLRQFKEGESVMIRNYGRGDKWLYGKITEVLGSRNYMVKTGDQVWKRHVDQLLKCEVTQATDIPRQDDTSAMIPLDLPTLTTSPEVTSSSTPEDSPASPVDDSHTPATESLSDQIESPPATQMSETPSTQRCSLRSNRRPPAYLKDYEQ